MAKLQPSDLRSNDPTGVGTSRAAVLLDAIQKGTPLEFMKGGKYAVQVKDPKIIDLLKAAADTLDEKIHDNLNAAIKGNGKFKYITKNGTVDMKLSDLEKTARFGSTKGSGGGAAGTALQESAAAWFSAVRFSRSKDLKYAPNDDEYKSVESIVDTDKSLKDIKAFLEEEPAWVDSCMATANALYGEFGKGTKNKFKWYRGGKFVDMLNDHFKTINNSYESPPFANLNKWTPADIWACECSVTKDQLTKSTNFASYNALLKEFIDKKILFGISLKKTTSNKITLQHINYTSKRPPKSTFDDIYAKSFDALDVWMYIKGGIKIEVQFRDTSGGKGLQWQGEAIGSLAKHGKIGGGVYSRILEEVTGTGLYKNVDVYKSRARSGGLNQRLTQLAQKYEDIINGSNNPKKTSGFVAPKITKETVDYHYNRTANKGQWVFSKYLGLMLVDRLMSMSKKERDEVSNLIALYATSQSKDSAPFLKAM